MGRVVRLPRGEFIDMWNSGVCGDRMAERFGINRSTVTKIAKRFGLKLRIETKVARRVIPADRTEEFAAMYIAMVTQEEMARAFGCNVGTIRNHAKRLWLPLRGKGNSSRFITLADYRAIQLRDRLAAAAREEQAALKLAEMVDIKGTSSGRAA